MDTTPASKSKGAYELEAASARHTLSGTSAPKPAVKEAQRASPKPQATPGEMSPMVPPIQILNP